MPSYEIALLTEEQIYAMVKNAKITMKEFMYWCNFQTDLAENEGRENMERYYDNA
jgi:hypothetical protein